MSKLLMKSCRDLSDQSHREFGKFLDRTSYNIFIRQFPIRDKKRFKKTWLFLLWVFKWRSKSHECTVTFLLRMLYKMLVKIYIDNFNLFYTQAEFIFWSVINYIMQKQYFLSWCLAEKYYIYCILPKVIELNI